MATDCAPTPREFTATVLHRASPGQARAAWIWTLAIAPLGAHRACQKATAPAGMRRRRAGPWCCSDSLPVPHSSEPLPCCLRAPAYRSAPEAWMEALRPLLQRRGRTSARGQATATGSNGAIGCRGRSGRLVPRHFRPHSLSRDPAKSTRCYGTTTRRGVRPAARSSTTRGFNTDEWKKCAWTSAKRSTSPDIGAR